MHILAENGGVRHEERLLIGSGPSDSRASGHREGFESYRMRRKTGHKLSCTEQDEGDRWVPRRGGVDPGGSAQGQVANSRLIGL